VLGVTLIFSQAAELMQLVRLVGAAYLFWLAWGAFRKAVNPPSLAIAEQRREHPLRVGLSGFLLQITNPKAIFFWLAIAGVGGVGDAPWPIVALFVVGAFVNSFAGHGGYALLLSSAPVRHAYARWRRWIEGGLGCLFVFVGWRLATDRL
jgi:threonine/homoserine/homoserine lactone efflux protein